ncbi:unnamed protein product [Prorocentrum cordatum]|uniref:Uncharacterized protein n=1 Tax=Prorocentrum cordatum TaxID=2364126 RepID=A0ABN9Q478_9DINO|nr:unnamed protein product [Polarella glacialis]
MIFRSTVSSTSPGVWSSAELAFPLGGGVAQAPGELTVSRISAPQREEARVRLRKPIPRRKGADIKFSAAPIEQTLRQRRALQPSASEPALAPGPPGRSSTELPHITASSQPLICASGSSWFPGSSSSSWRTGPRAAASAGASASLGLSTSSRWPSAGPDAERRAHELEGGRAIASPRSPASRAASPPPSQSASPRATGEGWMDSSTGWMPAGASTAGGSSAFQSSSQKHRGAAWKPNPWMGVLSGSIRVEAPFVATMAEGYCDTEACVHWYRSVQAEGQHRPLLSEGFAFGDQEREAQVSRMVLPWARERQAALQRLKCVKPESGWATHLRAQASLFARLDAAGVFRGPRALPIALGARLGSVEEAHKVWGRASMMELAGGLALLGVDPEVVCGLDERGLLQLADPTCSGTCSLDDIARLREPLAILRRKLEHDAARGPQARPAEKAEAAGGGAEDEEEPRMSEEERSAAQFKWVRVARWMAFAELRRALSSSQSPRRRGWRAPSGAEGAEVEGGAAEGGAAAAEALGAAFPGLELETLAMLREQDRTLKVFFAASASMRLQDGSRAMDMPDWLLFCSDLRLADPLRRPRGGAGAIERCYEEALAFQKARGGQQEGLAYAAFKVALGGLSGVVRLGWRALLVRLLDLGGASAAGSAAE